MLLVRNYKHTAHHFCEDIVKKQTLKATAFVLVTGLLLAVALPSSAEARDRSRSGGFTTDRGNSGTFSKSRSGNRGEGLHKERSITGENGRTFNRSSDSSFDRETKSFSKTVTGAKGNTRTYEGSVNDGGYQGTYETSRGKSGTFDGTVTKSEDGGWTRQGSVVNQDGKTFDRTIEGDYDRETHTLSKEITGANGKTRTYQGSVGRDEDGGVTAEKTWTSSDGDTYGRTSSYDYDKEGETLTRTLTNNQGKTRTGSVSGVSGLNQ